jgi:hypothetical protein
VWAHQNVAEGRARHTGHIRRVEMYTERKKVDKNEKE